MRKRLAVCLENRIPFQRIPFQRASILLVGEMKLNPRIYYLHVSISVAAMLRINFIQKQVLQGVKRYVSSDCKADTDKTSMDSISLPVNKSTEVAEYLHFRDSHVEHYPLPNYILNHPDHLVNVDISYLNIKDALTTPGISLRNEILIAYAQFVHPFLPILDLEQFVNTISQDNGVSRVSLLLLQAVLATGVAFVDVEHLQRAGYPTKKKACMAFSRRALLLYDFDFETERVTLTQSLLFMTYWHPPPNTSKRMVQARSRFCHHQHN